MHQQLWGYKVEEKLYLGVCKQKRLNTTGLVDTYHSFTMKMEAAGSSKTFPPGYQNTWCHIQKDYNLGVLQLYMLHSARTHPRIRTQCCHLPYIMHLVCVHEWLVDISDARWQLQLWCSKGHLCGHGISMTWFACQHWWFHIIPLWL
jgi:hypothetical protein